MKLAKMEITNFRCFESLSIPFHPDVNVLVGANGAGKTALLDAVAISLFNIVRPNDNGGPFQRDVQKTLLRSSDIYIAPSSENAKTGRKNFVRFRTVATDLYPIPNQKIPPPLSPQRDDESSTLAWDDEITYGISDHFEYHLTGSDQLQAYFKKLWDEVRNTPKAETPFPVVAYYRATRALSGMPEMGDFFNLTMNRGWAFENALDAGANYQAMCQWFYLRENQELREKHHRHRNGEADFSDLKAVRHALITMLDNVEDVFFDDNPPTLKIAWINPGNTPKVVSLEQLSDGYRNLLALVLDFARRLAQAHPHWKNPLETPGILMIDEIDLHLHPKWQQRVIPNLRRVFPNTQLIVTTHSPQILTTVHPENILILRDQKLYSPPVKTYGAESSRTLHQVMETESRPPDNEISVSIRKLFEMIHREQFSEAGMACERLMKEIGIDEPALLEADMIIKNRLWERELGL